MTKKQLVEEAHRALDKFLALPFEEQQRMMVAYGTINERGEVLMGLQEAREQEARERSADIP